MICRSLSLVVLATVLAGTAVASEHEAMENWKAEQRNDLERARLAAQPNDAGSSAAAGMADYYRQAAARAQADADAKAAQENAAERQRQAAYAEDARLRYEAGQALGFGKAGVAWRTYKSLVQQARAANDPRREIAALSWVPDDRLLGVEPVHVWNNLEKVSEDQITAWRRDAFGRLRSDAMNPDTPLGTRILYHRAVIDWIGSPGLHGDFFKDKAPGEMLTTLWYSLFELGNFGDPQAGALRCLLKPAIVDKPEAEPLQKVVLVLSRLRPEATGFPADIANVQRGMQSIEDARLVIAQVALLRLAQTPHAEPALRGTTREAAAQAAVAVVPSVGHFLAAELLRTAAPAQAAEHWRSALTQGELPLRVAAAWELAWPALVAGRDAEAGAILAGLPAERSMAASLVALGRSLSSGTGVPAMYPNPIPEPNHQLANDPVPTAVYLSRRTLAAVTAPGLPPRARQAAAFVLFTSLRTITCNGHELFTDDRIRADAVVRLQLAIEQGWLDQAAVLGLDQGSGPASWVWHHTNALVTLARGAAAEASPAERTAFIDRLAAGRCIGLIALENYSTIVPITAQEQARLAARFTRDGAR